MLRRHLVRDGLAVNVVDSLLGVSAMKGALGTGLTATGTTVVDALVVEHPVMTFTTVAASTGTLLPIMELGDEVYIANLGANALKVYPAEAKVGGVGAASGAGFGTGAADAAFSVAAGKTVFVKKISATLYLAFLSA